MELGQEIQDLGFLAWKDPWANLEKKENFTRHAKKEVANFRTTLRQYATAEEIRSQMVKEGIYTQEFQDEILFKHGPYEFRPVFGAGGGWEWRPVGKSKFKNSPAIEFWDDHIFTMKPETDSDFILRLESIKGSLWTLKTVLGPSILVYNNRVYGIEPESPLRYTRVVSFDCKTGGDRILHYEEKSATHQTTLIKVRNGPPRILSTEAGLSRLYECTATGYKTLVSTPSEIFPTGTESYLIRPGSIKAPWELRGFSLRLNKQIRSQGMEACLSEEDILVTREHGIRHFWRVSKKKEPVLLLSTVGIPIYNPWDPTLKTTWLIVPGSTPVKLHLRSGRLVTSQPKLAYAKCMWGATDAPDGRPVGWVLCFNPTYPRPRGLLLNAYGGYGSPSSLNTTRWRSWIEAGWAVATLFIRGGGDSNEEWAQAGRLGKKLDGLRDVEACCRELQAITGCGPERTCLFGRSAGGLIVGGIVARNPLGNMIRMAYAEVPYVDLLKTAANDTLPLTEYEYREFGNPRSSPANFESTLRVSPIHMLSPRGAPGIHVLCRAGKEDLQVLPYESLKWIYAIRGENPEPDSHTLYSVGDEGHFSSGMAIEQEHAEDFIVIQAWLAELEKRKSH
jgi:Prolyl oligopeptidase family